MKRFSIVICIIFILTLCFSLQSTEAASIIAWNIQQLDVSTSYDLCGGGLLWVDAGDSSEITWPIGFDISDLTISDTASESEIELYIGSTDCSGTPRIAEATETADNDRDYAVIDGQKLTIKYEDAYAGSTMSWKFVDKTDGDSNAIVTPATPGNYALVVRQIDVTTGEQESTAIADMLYVGDLNIIQINGTIDPTLTLAVVELGTDSTATTCALGTLGIENIETCGYRTKVSTNADDGYTAFIRADGAFTSGTHDMTAVGAADDIDPGVEEYGISSSDTDADIIENTSGQTCAALDHQLTYPMPADPLSTDDQSIRVTGASVDSEYTTICHAAGISGLTPAGAYTQTVTITVVGNF